MIKEDTMKNTIETPKISEILLRDFMQPLGISAYKLAKDIHYLHLVYRIY